MLAEDADVTDKFLHVIRQRRKEKYGKKLYGSDETDQDHKKTEKENVRHVSEKNLPGRFDAEGYLHDLVTRNKIRKKLKAARERHNNMLDSEGDSDDEDDEEPKPKGPSLLSKIKDGSVTSSMHSGEVLSRAGDHWENSKDSGKGTPSVATVSYNDGNVDHNSPSKTMKRVRIKMNSVRHLSSIDELKHRYQKESQKQMELLETIRQLRGINKDDFYKDFDNSSDEEVTLQPPKPRKQSLVPKSLIPKSVKSQVVEATIEHVEKMNNGVTRRTRTPKSGNKSNEKVAPTAVKTVTKTVDTAKSDEKKDDKTENESKTNKDTVDKMKNDSSKNANNEAEVTETAVDDLLPSDVNGYEDNDLDFERELSPIANQMLTPDRISTPDTPDFAAVSTAGCTPEPSPSPEPTSEPEKESVLIDIAEREPAPVEEPQRSEPKSPDTSRRLKLRSGKLIRIRGSRVDSRWPSGHRYFTKPMPANFGKNYRNCYYARDRVLSKLSVKQNDLHLNRRRDAKLRQSCFGQDSWRETLIRIAYEKEFEYLKRRSLTLFPYKQSPLLDAVGSLDSMKKYKGPSHLNYPSKQDILSRRTKRIMDASKSNVVKNVNVNFDSVHKHEEEHDTSRVKSGQESNDLGYDSGDNVVDSVQSYSPAGQKLVKVTITNRKRTGRNPPKRVVKADNRTTVW